MTAVTAASLRVLVCPQEFKGSLTAAEAARAIAAGLRRALPGAAVSEAPMADGGPGTVAIVCRAAGGEIIDGRHRGPLGEPVEAAYALLPVPPAPPPLPPPARAGPAAAGLVAVIEAAATAGLTLVPAARRDPARASTHGVGEQLRDALRRGAREVIVGVGGTGTNDGGAGAAQALGYRLLDAAGGDLPPGGAALARLARIDAGAAEPLLRGAVVRVAADVTNRLLGAQGATAVYGPQKGVTAALAPRLEAALGRWAERCRRDLGVEIAALEGGGAGGGLAAGLAAAAGARIERGAALVGEAIALPAAVQAADVVVTGEGRLDEQTGYGKTVAYVASLARAAGRPCLAVAGRIVALPGDALPGDALPAGVAAAEEAAPAGMPPAEAMRRAAELVEAAAARLARHIDAATARP